MPEGLMEAIIACIIFGSAYDSVGSLEKSGVECDSGVDWYEIGGGGGGRDGIDEGTGNDDGGGSFAPESGMGRLPRGGRGCCSSMECFIDNMTSLSPPHAWRRSRKGGVPNTVTPPPKGFALSGDTIRGGGKSKLVSGGISSSILMSDSSSSSSSSISDLSSTSTSVSGEYISKDGRIAGVRFGSTAAEAWEGTTGRAVLLKPSAD